MSGAARAKPRVPLRYWALWWAILLVADVVFYVLLTPIWMGLRAAAWTAEFRARRRRTPPDDRPSAVCEHPGR
ncbi:MAG TPA: hypothetical protein VFJ77_01895 [Gaiellaceae bacterium]|nr:hypothetical protein [Gaiellaceae bacterium]